MSLNETSEEIARNCGWTSGEEGSANDAWDEPTTWEKKDKEKEELNHD